MFNSLKCCNRLTSEKWLAREGWNVQEMVTPTRNRGIPNDILTISNWKLSEILSGGWEVMLWCSCKTRHANVWFQLYFNWLAPYIIIDICCAIYIWLSSNPLAHSKLFIKLVYLFKLHISIFQVIYRLNYKLI